LLADADPSVRFWAATALGRIGSAESVPALLAALAEKDLYARYAAFTALNRIGRADPAAWAAVGRGLSDPDPAVREGTAFALRETYDEKLVGVLADVAGNAAAPAEARTAALGLLGTVCRKKPEWKGEWWAYHPVNGPPPARTAEWAGTPAVRVALRAGLTADRPAVRRAAVAAVREARDAAAAPTLRDLYRTEADREVRGELLAALGALKDKEAGGLIRAVLEAPDRHPGLVAAAVAAGEQIGGPEVAAGLRGFVGSAPKDKELLVRAALALGIVKDAAAVPLLTETAGRDDADVRRAALSALARVGGAAAQDALLGLAGNPRPDVRRDAVAALGELKTATVVPKLLEAYADPETRAAALQALTRVPDPRAADAYLDGLGDKDVQVREQCRQAVAATRKAVLPRAEARADTLPAAALTLLRQVYADDRAARKGKLFTAGKAAAAEEYLAFARDNPGDPTRGAKLFADTTRLACAKCHKVNGQGGEIGPDLSTIGAQFDRAQLAEAVLYPSRAIREGYHQMTVTTVDGRVVSGLVRAESADAITLRDADGKDHTIRADDIDKRSGSGVSLMPEGLHAGITPPEFADLVSYLSGLRPPK
jgi:putative heme-binding domain-containing protein